MTDIDDPGTPTYYHGSKAQLEPGQLIAPGHASNYGQRRLANFVYLSETLEAATWGAELAQGEGRGRIYIVEPTGAIEDDPNLTNKKFAGNPTKSYRSRAPLRVVGEVTEWTGHSPERLKEMLDRLSPLYKLDRIKAATMVQHGANDTNVPVIEAEQIVNTLKQRGVPVEYVLFPDEGHGWRKTANRIRSIAEEVNFFDAHLKQGQ